MGGLPSVQLVVICFRSLNLWYLAQPTRVSGSLSDGCDLLSFFEFMIFGTTSWNKCSFSNVLWFAFVLWIYDIWHNCSNLANFVENVVICFRSLNLWYLAQRTLLLSIQELCCDLLSFFEFMIFGTTWV